jgi:hypothetical protein
MTAQGLPDVHLVSLVAYAAWVTLLQLCAAIIVSWLRHTVHAMFEHTAGAQQACMLKLL